LISLRFPRFLSHILLELRKWDNFVLVSIEHEERTSRLRDLSTARLFDVVIGLLVVRPGMN
jgi:hypothetical protein